MAHPTEWCVAVGRPSYHQARAGHGSAGEMCWSTKLKALRYMANVRRRNKHETMTLIPPRGGLSGGRRKRRSRR